MLIQYTDVRSVSDILLELESVDNRTNGRVKECSFYVSSLNSWFASLYMLQKDPSFGNKWIFYFNGVPDCVFVLSILYFCRGTI